MKEFASRLQSRWEFIPFPSATCSSLKDNIFQMKDLSADLRFDLLSRKLLLIEI